MEYNFLCIIYYSNAKILPAYCCRVSFVVSLLNGGISTGIKVEDLFNKDSKREQSICSVTGFSRSEKIAIIGRLINCRNDSTAIL